MKPIANISEVKEAGSSERLCAGGYICKYTKVEDVADKSYLYMEYDIAEGNFANYYKSLEESFGFWGGRCIRSYKETALPMFKRMCSAVTASNPGYLFDGNTNADEKTLVGKYVGLILGEEEYIGNDGSLKTRLYVSREVPVDKIKEGKFKVPELKKMQTSADIPSNIINVDANADEEVPFN